MDNLSALIPELKNIIINAGKATLEVYEAADPIEVTSKSDDSPVTKADLAAHNIIEAGLQGLPVDYPILSEEGGMPEFSERSAWSRYWLIDPLDGTKEFINKNGEFTINIALIESGKAILGLVYVPVKETLYYGLEGDGAYKELSGETSKLEVGPVDTASRLNVVGSRRHGAEALDAMLDNVKATFPDINLVSMGSSLKICAIAEGTAHWYPRLALTSEWDTAAAHAVLSAAGGEILDIDLNPLTYNQKADILNPFFHAIGSKDFDWKSLIANAS